MSILLCRIGPWGRRLLNSFLAFIFAVGMCVPVLPAYADDEVGDDALTQLDEQGAGDEHGVGDDDNAEGLLDEIGSAEGENPLDDKGTEGDGFADSVDAQERADDELGKDSIADESAVSLDENESTGEPEGGFIDSVVDEGTPGQSPVSNLDGAYADPELPSYDSSAQTNLSELWQAGKTTVSVPGRYVLEDDVQAAVPLSVSIPEGESAVIDLAGHDVRIILDKDASSDGWKTAVDLSMNRGSVSFIDSAYEAAIESSEGIADESAANALHRGSIALSVDASVQRCAVVLGPQAISTADVSFSNVRLAVELTGDESYEQGGAEQAKARGIIKASDMLDQDEAQSAVDVASDGFPPLAFNGCLFQITDLTANVQDFKDGIFLIDASASRVMLDGKTGASAEGEAVRESLSSAGALLAEGEFRYVIGSNFELATNDEPADVPLVFGFPRGVGEDAAQAGVCATQDGEVIPQGAVAAFGAARGYELVFDEATDGAQGYFQATIRRVSEEALGAQEDSEEELSWSLGDAGLGQGDASSFGDGEAAGGSGQAIEETAPESMVVDGGIASSQDIASGQGASGQAQVPTADVQADTDGLQSQPMDATPLFPQASDDQAEVDLGETWKAQSGGLDVPYTISEGATYYLSEDVTAKSNLIINAPNQDVVIKLNGHKLVVNGAGEALHKTMVSVEAANSVLFDGSSTDGTSVIESAGEADVWGISVTAPDCNVSAFDLSIKLHSKTNAQRNLSVHAVRSASGTLALERCIIDLDMGNQSLKSTDLLNDRAPEVPSAVYASNGVQSVVLDECEVHMAGPQGFGLSDASDLKSIGNAYAVYSLGPSTQVKGGSFEATSLRGNATCLYADFLTISQGQSGVPVKLKAGAALVAAGVLSAKAGSVFVDAPLEFSAAEGFEGSAKVSSALRESVVDGFAFGAGFAQEGASPSSMLVMTGKDPLSANKDNEIAGTVSSGLSQEQQTAIASSLSNALPDGACALMLEGNKLVFKLDSQRAVARLDDGRLFSTIDEALAAFENGQTLTLLADVGALAIENVSDATLDLNNHSIDTLEYAATSPGAGFVVSNGIIRGTKQVGGDRMSVYHHAAAPLTLSGVEVNAAQTDARVCGVYAASKAGNLKICDNTRIFVRASHHSATASASGYGVYMANNGPELTLDHAALSVTTASAGVAVYGAYSTVDAHVADSAVNVTGATESACALYIGGALDATSSILKVNTTDISQRACGIWARTANPKATDVAIDGCSIIVGSTAKDISGSQYSCLVGATSQNGSAAPTGAWKLSGQCLFKSLGGIHVGLNVGSIEVADDFALSAFSDSQIVVSQSKRENDVGVMLSENTTAARAQQIAGLFAAAQGSHYESWNLVADVHAERASKLVWRPDGYAQNGGIVEVVNGSTTRHYATLSDALKTAQSGSVVRLLADLAEPNAVSVSQDNLKINLDGHTLTLRAGSEAKVANTSAGGAFSYEGAGKLSIANGALRIEAGSASEISGSLYQGVSIIGGGTLAVERDCAVHVRYSGSTLQTATQQTVALRGIAVSNGTLEFSGDLTVASARAEGAVGALQAYGIFSDPAAGNTASVDVAQEAVVTVDNITAAKTVKNLYYAETTPDPVPQGGAYGLREITIDPEVDPDFYNDVVDQFQHTASFDDPQDTTARNTFSASIYYIDAMTLAPENEDAWYYGLKVWAYSDEVAAADVGKKDHIVPTHFFVSSPYDVLPDAYGIATSAQAAGTASVNVSGNVSANCSHGNAYTLDADSAEGSQVSWTCTAAGLAAQGDTLVHNVAGEAFDLRNYIEFSSTQNEKVAYPGATISKVVSFANAEARNAVVGAHVEFAFDGATKFQAQAGDAASVEASAFGVGGSFSLVDGSQTCSVANPAGANEARAVFAAPTSGSRLDAKMFEDAYGACVAGLDGAGQGVWQQADGFSVLFKVGDAIVARRRGPGSISLSGPSAAAERMADQRQNYTLVGWSPNPDEHATSGYLDANGAVTPTEECTYYAVYETGMVDVPVTFANVFDGQGQLLEIENLSARYGQTVGEALEAAGRVLPEPSSYTDESSGLSYRFAGWHPYYKTTTVSPLIYDANKVKELAVTLSVNGVSGGGLVLRAVYEAASERQHLVTFVVDGYASTCVVDEGARPQYVASNASNTNYVVPSKQATETGKTFTFKGWFVDVDGDGEVDEDETLYTSILPPATQDVTYTAAWSWKWSDITYTFNIKKYDEASGTVVNNAVRVIKTTYEKPVQEHADSVAKVGDAFGAGGRTYTLLGWSKRKTDVDPLYDQDHKLPSASSSDRAINDTYSSTYYGVYSISDHMVDVTFFDGEKELGTARVVAGRTTVNVAFDATSASKPADKSADSIFLGWAARPDVMTNVEGTSTTIESLAPGAQESLSLYAIYGKPPVYTVRLRSDDGKQTLYLAGVKRGSTVNAALAKAGVSITVASKEGKYFAGWRTAAGTFFSLDTPVTGSMDCYASYADVVVTTKDSADISAMATVSYEASSAVTPSTGLTSMELALTPRDSADTPLRATTAKNGYSILKSYDIRLHAIGESGDADQVTGDFGVANIKIYVGTGYRNSKVRVFWLGEKDGSEAVMNSTVKDVDDDGYISVSIGNFMIGDEDEGGNLAVAYVEGGAGSGSLSGVSDDEGDEVDPNPDPGTNAGSTDSSDSMGASLPSSSGGSSGLGLPGSDGTAGLNNMPDAGGASGLGGTSGLDGSTAPGAGLSSSGTSGLSGSLGVSGSSGLTGSGVSGLAGSSSGLSSSLSGSSGLSSLSGTSGTSSVGSSSSTLGSNAEANLSSSKAMPSAAGGEGNEESKLDAAGQEAEGGWDSNAVVLILVLLALGALLGRKLWMLFGAKRRRDDDDEEPEDELANDVPREGIRF